MAVLSRQLAGTKVRLAETLRSFSTRWLMPLLATFLAPVGYSQLYLALESAPCAAYGTRGVLSNGYLWSLRRA
jgi:hypothetical protein